MEHEQKEVLTIILKDKTTLILSKEEFEDIRQKLIVETMISEPIKISMVQDVGLKRANMLYDVYKSQSKDMSDDLKNKYLRQILIACTENNLELMTLADAHKSIKNN